MHGADGAVEKSISPRGKTADDGEGGGGDGVHSSVLGRIWSDLRHLGLSMTALNPNDTVLKRECVLGAVKQRGDTS